MPPKSNHGQGHGQAPDSGADGFRNHGAEVSAAAHDAPKGRGSGHGQAVSDVARSDPSDLTPDPGTRPDADADALEPVA